MSTSTILSPQIRENVLRDPRYPVHRIADQLLPYLQVLVEQFHPEQVILFGSYAYGEPTEDSDVDLLVVKEIANSCGRRSKSGFVAGAKADKLQREMAENRRPC